ncbi:hypothetical protein B0H65DRAFT_566026 [Neurospora tetraspora]|uniref:Uncharacterized protein n=1 Tax=Neurospora tetraspora TaxID=94610 RepID=A0AAE0J0G7_9PEZI|nr:hypothetical protein B0H65DRAFT_566026 [Neurospora tetraspora]
MICTGCTAGVAGRGPNLYCWQCFHTRKCARLRRERKDDNCPGCLWEKCPNRQFGWENHRREKHKLYPINDEENNDDENNDEESNYEGDNDEEDSDEESNYEGDNDEQHNDEENNDDRNDNKHNDKEEDNNDEDNDSEDDKWRGWHKEFCLQSKQTGLGYYCRGCLWTGCPNRSRGHLFYNIWGIYPNSDYKNNDNENGGNENDENDEKENEDNDYNNEYENKEEDDDDDD